MDHERAKVVEGAKTRERADDLPANQYPMPTAEHFVAVPEERRRWPEWYALRARVHAEHRARLHAAASLPPPKAASIPARKGKRENKANDRHTKALVGKVAGARSAKLSRPAASRKRVRAPE